MTSNADLSTQQAADLLNVSHPFIIGLLESGDIASRVVADRRRVDSAALMDYLCRDDQRRREAADELTASSRALGLD